MRGRPAKRRIISPDHTYNSVKVAKFINYIMERGKKNAARAIVYGAFEDLRKGGAADPLEVFEEAIKNIGPLMEVRSRRIGGANYQVPREVSPQRRLALAMRWLIEAAESRKGSPMRTRLKEELSAASKKEGEAVKRRENTHKMAEANRAFAHFSW